MMTEQITDFDRRRARKERIKFLYYVAKMPEGVRCDRMKARMELSELLQEEGYGFDDG